MAVAYLFLNFLMILSMLFLKIRGTLLAIKVQFFNTCEVSDIETCYMS